MSAQLVEVRFKGNRKAYFEWQEPEPLRPPEPVIVEAERGLDYGLVSTTGDLARRKCERCGACKLGNRDSGLGIGDSDPVPIPNPQSPTPRIVRRATQTDRRSHEELRRHEDEVRRKVREKAAQHGLDMKVSDVEWQWDRNKLSVFFTADRRVDFRTLVRDLASSFRTRVELRQIGVRDEAARLGGIGRCGRELCSASWLPELLPIGLQVAKDQRLSLNPSQISGPCGRLLCCLRYEHEFYVQSRRRFPKEGKLLHTSRGAEKVHAIDIFRDRVTLKGEDGTTRSIGLEELQTELKGLGIGDSGLASREPAVLSQESASQESAQSPIPNPQSPSRGRRRRRRRRPPPPPPSPEAS